jgi:hypothetical protein
MPLAPARICRHTSGAVLPTPQSNPTPVMTTLRSDTWDAAWLNGYLPPFAFFSM